MKAAPGQFGDARLESGLAVRILALAIDAAHQVTVALGFLRHEPVHPPHPQHRIDDLVVQQFRQLLFDLLGRQVLQAQPFALAQPEHVLEKANASNAAERAAAVVRTCMYAMAGLMYVAEFTLSPNCLLNTASARKLSDSAGLAGSNWAAFE